RELRRASLALRGVPPGRAFGALAREQAEVGNYEWDAEVEHDLHPGHRSRVPADDHIGLVDEGQDHADDKRDPYGAAQRVAPHTDGERLRDSASGLHLADCHGLRPNPLMSDGNRSTGSGGSRRAAVRVW